MLDFNQVAGQIRDFTAERESTLPRLEAARSEAAARLASSSAEWETARDRLAASRTSWLVADWLEDPDSALPLPARPLPHAVLATDGSQIVTDRHDIALFYLLNVGCVALRYGTGERPRLTSHPLLAEPDDDLLDEFQGEEEAIAPRRLAMKRQRHEMESLAAMIAEEAGRSGPTLALCDGSLILWPLETEKPKFRDETLAAFERSLETARQSRTPIAGYISRSNSHDVIHALRVCRCPHPHAHCDTYCPDRIRPRPAFRPPDCAGTEHITDADLFFRRLQPGERSAVFASRSPILQRYAEENSVCFFYLHTGGEAARIEIPRWVAEDPELLDWTHALCYDQINKGDGYPVALAEAHEQAIVRGPERSAFLHLLETTLVRERQTVTISRKAVSKRSRRV